MPNTKTGLAGVRSRVYTELWRDKVILEALRIFRARTEGASLDTVPEVTLSQKPTCDGRADKSVAQRGIMGFEPAQARRGYIRVTSTIRIATLTSLTCLRYSLKCVIDIYIGRW